jgi:hypothetical protein
MSSHESCHAARKKNNSKAATAKSEVANAIARFSLPGPRRSDEMSCCPLTSGSILAASRVQANDNQASAAAANASTSLESFSASPAPPTVPLRLHIQNHLYLRGCAFLI